MILRQREQLNAAREQVTQSKQQIASLRKELEALRNQLHLAEQQSAQLPPPPAADDSDAAQARHREIADWLGHLKQLKGHFEQRPEQRIPQMQLLTDDDWLKAARSAGFDTEEQVRRALAEVRYAAKRTFSPKLAGALKKFMQASPSFALAQRVVIGCARQRASFSERSLGKRPPCRIGGSLSFAGISFLGTSCP